MKVLWTEPAQEKLRGIAEHVGESSGSVEQANTVVRELLARARQLEAFPRLGRIVPEYQDQKIREIIVVPYRLIYRIKTSQIEILTVVHGAKLLPHELS